MLKWNKLWLFGHPPLHSLSWSLSSATWGNDKRISVAVWWKENWPKARQMFCYSSEPLCWPRTSSIFKSASQINRWFTPRYSQTPTNAAFVPTVIRIFIDIKQWDCVWSCCTWLYAFASSWAAVLVFIRKRLPGSQRQSLFQVENPNHISSGFDFVFSFVFRTLLHLGLVTENIRGPRTCEFFRCVKRPVVSVPLSVTAWSQVAWVSYQLAVAANSLFWTCSSSVPHLTLSALPQEQEMPVVLWISTEM